MVYIPIISFRVKHFLVTCRGKNKKEQEESSKYSWKICIMKELHDGKIFNFIFMNCLKYTCIYSVKETI